MTATTYVRFKYPGVIVPEESFREVTSRDPKEIASIVGDSVYAFQFYDVHKAVVDGIKMTSGIVNESVTYFPNAEKLSLADMKRDMPDIAVTMERNHWDYVARTQTGNITPMEAGDKVISYLNGRWVIA
jgi:hypothetical protein